MSNRDNRLKGAKNLSVSLGTIRRTDQVGRTDREDLYRFNLKQRSPLNLTLTKLDAGQCTIELYALKRPLAQVLRQIGKLDFSQIRRKDRVANLKPIAAAKLNASQNPGTYLVRVLYQSSKKTNSRYRLQITATSPSPDTASPIANLSATNLAVGGGTSYDFTVTYQDNVAVDVSSINSNNILVESTNGFSQFASQIALSDNSNGNLRSVTYRITAPGGSWDSADNGNYSIALQANQIRDTSGNIAMAQQLGNFQVNITPTPVADQEAPTASLLSINPTTRDLTIVYRDNVAINAASIDDNDIRVTAPGGASLVTRVITNESNDTTRTVTYRITPPGGGWDSTDNGTYQIAIQPNQVNDTSNNFALSQLLGNFAVNIPVRSGNRYSVTGSDETLIKAQFNLFSTAPDGTTIVDQDPSSTIGLFTGAIGNFISGSGRLTGLLDAEVDFFNPDDQIVISALNLRAELIDYDPVAQTGKLEYRIFQKSATEFQPEGDETLFGIRFNLTASFFENFDLNQSVNSLTYIVTNNLFGDGTGAPKPSGLGFSDNLILDGRDITGGTVFTPPPPSPIDDFTT
ncbi:MAG: hypothetical protein MUF72_18130 [Elainella sp. Prado103]|jgi:hypothetical protein|nr:hypothetical protein [Elainella sp. Prado103]